MQRGGLPDQDSPAQICKFEPCSPQILAVAARVRIWREEGTAHLILQKNKQEPRSIASLDPEEPAPPGSVPGDVRGGDSTSSAPGQGLGPFSTPAPARLPYCLRPSKGLIVQGKCQSGSSSMNT